MGEPSMLSKTEKNGGFWGIIKIVTQALLIALVIRTLLFQPFDIPSGSPIPTLLVGDYLFASKYAHGYSRCSVPFGPAIFLGRVWSAEPKRGDVVVFKWPKDNSTDYIKRVTGLSGDRIQMIGGILHINGKPVQRERVEDYTTYDLYGRRMAVPQYVETLPNGVSIGLLNWRAIGGSGTTRPCIPCPRDIIS